MTASRFVRLHLPVLALAAVPLLLALRFGGYHPRHAGWAVLALGVAACVAAALGKLSALRSASGVATVAMLALVAWTTASITWADVSTHDAWVEGMRATGHAATFLLGGALLATARSFVRFATLVGAGIGLLALAALTRIAWSGAPLASFVAGRLDWPIGYAPAMAGFCLMGALLLLGVACGAQQRWQQARAPRELVAGGVALGGATACVAVALLAQSRGTLPALLVGVVVALLATPQRSAWLLRAGAAAVLLLAVGGRLAAPFRTQFDLRQAPFTEGADEAALGVLAETAARDAAGAALAITLVATLLGAALVPVGAWLATQLADVERRAGGRPLALPITSAVVALLAALLVVTADRDGSPARWAAEQWRGCVDPPERVDDPGTSSSYFANTGTGRCDYYRVALGAAAQRPLLGLGAGNFRGEYVRERATAEEPRVVHSLPLQLLAELGIVGALLGATVLACVIRAAVLFVASGPARDAAFAGAIGAIGYWTAHASIDWLWQLPAVTLPAMALGGGLVACVSPAQRAVQPRVVAPIAAGIALALVALVLPVTMADEALRRARDPELRERDPAAALAAARDAQSYDPGWAEPAITEAVLHFEAGRRSEAADAARRAVQLEPDSWSTHYRASGLIGLDDTVEGRAAFERARELNPRLPSDVRDDDLADRQSTDPDSLQNPDA